MRVDSAGETLRGRWHAGIVLCVVLFAGCGGEDQSLRGQADAGVCESVTIPDCPTPAPTYASVQPILQSRCAGCHGGVPSGPWPLDTYEHVADWQDTIRSKLLSCAMPPPGSGASIEESEKLQLLIWIRCGAPP